MSIFNQNINDHPLEKLLDEVEWIVGYTISRELCHYNAEPNHLRNMVWQELMDNELTYDLRYPKDSQIHSVISRVDVSRVGYKRNLPVYSVSLYTVDWSSITNDVYFPHFIDIYVSVGGVIHGSF